MASMSFTADESRGQLILVGGVVIAVLLITVGIVFNTALYTEAQSVGKTYNGEAAVSEDLKDSFRIDIRQTIKTENEQMDGEAVEDVKQVVSNINTYSQKRQARYGVVTDLDHEATVSGTRLAWTNTSRAFTNPDGNATWEIASGINTIRQYRLSLQTEQLAELSNPSPSELKDSSFGITFNPDDPNNKTRYLYVDSNTDTLKIEGVDASDTVTMTCSIGSASPSEIHLTTDSISTPLETTPCRDLWPDIDVETIQYTNGDQAYGKFHFVANDGLSTPEPDDLDTADALYSMEVDYRYKQSNVEHTTTTRIAPNEP